MDVMKEPMYNSIIIFNYIKLIESKYSYVDIEALLRNAGMERHQVEDAGHWFSQDQINGFHQRLNPLVWNKDIAREAGAFASSPEALGSVRLLIFSLVGPDQAYGLFTKSVSRFTRSSTYKSRKLGPHKTEITVTAKPGVREESFQCSNRHGYLEAMARSMRLQLPKIEHPECMFRGDPCCRYVISWSSSANRFVRKAGIAGVILFPVLLLVLSMIFSFREAALLLLPWAVAAALALVLFLQHLTLRNLRFMLSTVREVSEDFFDQNQENYDLSRFVHEIGLAMGAKDMTQDSLLESIAARIEGYLPYDRGIIFLPDDAEDRLHPQAWFGATTEQLDILRTYPGQRLDPVGPSGIAAQAYLLQRPYLVGDVEQVMERFSPEGLEFVRQLQIKSYIACPIIYAGKSLGVLTVDNRITMRTLRQRDLDLLMGIASLIALGIHSSRMEDEYRERQKSFFRLVKG